MLSLTSSLFSFMMHFVLFSDGGAAVSYRNTWFLHFLPNPTKPNCGIQRLNLRTILVSLSFSDHPTFTDDLKLMFSDFLQTFLFWLQSHLVPTTFLVTFTFFLIEINWYLSVCNRLVL